MWAKEYAKRKLATEIELKLTEDYPIELHHDPELIKRAIMIADETGRIPRLEEIADAYPKTYLDDIALMRRMIHFQVSHLVDVTS